MGCFLPDGRSYCGADVHSASSGPPLALKPIACSTAERASSAAARELLFGLGFDFVRLSTRSILSFQTMRTPYGLEIIENCLACPHRQERLFCDLPPAAVQALSTITSSAAYPKGATLFVEGQTSRGVFILCTGRVKLSTGASDGTTLIARVSREGEVLGLPATVTGRPYELTAEVIEPTQANFISRAEFLKFLRENGEASLRIAQQLAETYQNAVHEMRTIGLTHSAQEKVAQFLLEQSEKVANGKDAAKITLTFTHEEIGQMVGASRETVSRTFGEFKRRKLIQVKGSSFTIASRAALKEITEAP
jgi:CRP/FNR family transcriptional regulator, cyclic AMP receptor protein